MRRFGKLSARVLLLALILSVPWSRVGLAHHESMTRSLWIEPAGVDRLDVVLELRVPHDRPVVRLADADLDGRLSPDELERMKADLAALALDGLQLFAGTSTAALRGVETKVRRTRDGSVEFMALGTVDVPRTPTSLAVSNAKTSLPCRIVLVSGARPVRTDGEFVRCPEGLETSLMGGRRVGWALLAP